MAKRWKEAIAACEAEIKDSHKGSAPADSLIWKNLRKHADEEAAKDAQRERDAALAAEAAKRKALEAAANKEIVDAVVAERKQRLLAAKSKLSRTKSGNGPDNERQLRRLNVEIKVLERLLTEKNPIDYTGIK